MAFWRPPLHRGFQSSSYTTCRIILEKILMESKESSAFAIRPFYHDAMS